MGETSKRSDKEPSKSDLGGKPSQRPDEHCPGCSCICPTCGQQRNRWRRWYPIYPIYPVYVPPAYPEAPGGPWHFQSATYGPGGAITYTTNT